MDTTFSDLISLPNVKHVVYDNPPLALVICQIRFRKILKLSIKEVIAEFQDNIRDIYPIIGEYEKNNISKDDETENPWIFRDKEDIWRISLSEDFITLETRLYSNFDDFLSKTRFALDNLFALVKRLDVTRIGVRYVNEIVEKDIELNNIINQDALGPLRVNDIYSHTQLCIQQIILTYHSEQGININHGLVPPKTRYINKELNDQRYYLFDIDVYRNFTDIRMNIDNILGFISDYKNIVYRFFRWFVSDEYLQNLGVSSDD